ncbi:MAG: hypothetical protein Athens071416_497 [Parcubacteria group bacterium Athens0714_16]|nr:MAG: hypothetical protein Athens071416_497 [Parcubacteria group bacterium Athens0714_16]
MANKTKLIEYSFTEKDDDGHNNKVHTLTKRAIFLKPEDNYFGIGFLIIKSSFGNSPHVIYLFKKEKDPEIESFCFGDNFGIEGFPIPGQPNADSWDKIRILSSENLLSDGQVESLVSHFKTAIVYSGVKISIWQKFKDKL